MLRVCQYRADGTFVDGGAELLAEPGPKWVDVVAPDESTMKQLQERFGLHKLAVEDCLHFDQRPKLEEYPNHLLLVLHGFTCAHGKFEELAVHEMHLCLGPDWLLTVHSQENAAIADARKRMEADPPGTFGRGADFLAYLVADALIDRNFPLLDTFNEEMEELENAIFEAPRRAQLQRIFQLKRTLVSFRRVLSPQRDVVVVLTRRGVPHVSERTTLYFRDVYDHLARLYEQVDAGRDILGNAMEGYLSMVANRTGEITKQLTLFATVFLPLSFVVGFFGQNFPQLVSPATWVVMWCLIAAIPLASLLWFRLRRWL